MGCAGSKEDEEMIDAIGEKPTKPEPTGDAMTDAMAMQAYEVELPAWNRRRAKYKAEAAENNAAGHSQQGLPPKAEAQQAEADRLAEEAKKKKEAEAEKEAAAERRRQREEERKKNDPVLQKIAADRAAREEARKKKAVEDALKAEQMEEERMLQEMEAAEETKRVAAAKALEEAAARKEAEARAKAKKEEETILDLAMRRMFSRQEADEAPPPDERPRELKPIPLKSSFGFPEPTGRWDDGGKCADVPGGLTLACSVTGLRPRPQHEFRCRMRDELLSNAEDRPVCPTNLEDKMAMRRYEKDMDEWQPAWLDEDDDEVPELDRADAYPLHCPRCEGKTKRYGEGGLEFSTSLRIVVSATEWLPSSYKYAMNAPEAVSERRFLISTGQFGHCVKCKLLVQATVEAGEGQS